MNIIGVQLILIFFALFMIYVIYLHWKKKNIQKRTFVFWLFLWLVFIVFTLFPQLLQPLLKDLFVIRVMDLGMLGAFMILTYITIENNIKMREFEEQLEKLVRNLSIKKLRK